MFRKYNPLDNYVRFSGRKACVKRGKCNWQRKRANGGEYKVEKSRDKSEQVRDNEWPC